ncbi:MAG: hypothetical protein M0Q91_13325 [Methanoregula sp.]|jgi:hypothetical protein|nr:hypothetical protein [Methanoregula sp.]
MIPPVVITEYKMSIDLISRDHGLLNDTVIEILRQLNKIPGVDYEVGPLLGWVVEANEPPRATVYEGVGL